MNKIPKTAILHYSAPPVIGGVEAVMSAHARIFLQEGFPIKIIAGRGDQTALPPGTEFEKIPLLDSQHEMVLQVNEELKKGVVNDSYKQLRGKIKTQLERSLSGIDNLIVHNIFSKNFNLALTAALISLYEEKSLPNCIAWCHDFSVKSTKDKKALHEGDPWNILKTYYLDFHYVVVSGKRQEILSEILNIPKDEIDVIYNGFDPEELSGIIAETSRLVEHLKLNDSDLIVLMPVRITKAKNIEFAMRVTAKLKQKIPNIKMILTGPPDPHDPKNLAYFNKLIHLRYDLGIQNNFKFIYEENPGSDEPNILDMKIVADLYRICDLVFMPSHREGFGMPVIEAGFSGKPVFSTSIPAAEEIGGDEIHFISLEDGPQKTADQIFNWAASDPVHLFRVRTRQNFTWKNIFHNKIRPLLVLD